MQAHAGLPGSLPAVPPSLRFSISRAERPQKFGRVRWPAGASLLPSERKMTHEVCALSSRSGASPSIARCWLGPTRDNATDPTAPSSFGLLRRPHTHTREKPTTKNGPSHHVTSELHVLRLGHPMHRHPHRHAQRRLPPAVVAVVHVLPRHQAKMQSASKPRRRGRVG